jgi:hypothetical protein
MKGWHMRASWLFLLLSVCFLPAQAQGGKGLASFTFRAGYSDVYLFRGRNFNDDATQLGEFSFGIGKFAYTLNYAEPMDEGFGTIDQELSHAFSYTTIAGNRVTTIGYQFLNYDGLQPDTQEFFTRVRHLNRWNTNYGLTFDFDTYKGYYFDYSFRRDFPLTKFTVLQFGLDGGIALDLDPSINAEGTVTEPGFFGDDGFTHSKASVQFLWQASRWFSVETGVHYNYAWDEALYEPQDLDQGTFIWRSWLTFRLQ